MSREIKFRYTWKRKEDGHIWVEIVPLGCLENKGDRPFVVKKNHLWDMIGRDQYIGLKDKNGKEIYEGDIDESGGLVIWNDDDASFLLDIAKIETQSLECAEQWMNVIGNIHENPELLEEKP